MRTHRWELLRIPSIRPPDIRNNDNRRTSDEDESCERAGRIGQSEGKSVSPFPHQSEKNHVPHRPKEEAKIQPFGLIPPGFVHSSIFSQSRLSRLAYAPPSTRSIPETGVSGVLDSGEGRC